MDLVDGNEWKGSEDQLTGAFDATLTFASWNQIANCLRKLEALRQVV